MQVFDLLLKKSYWIQFIFLLFSIVVCASIFLFIAIVVNKIFELEAGTRIFIYVNQFIITLGIFLVPAFLFSLYNTNKWFAYSHADKTIDFRLVGYVTVLSLFIIPIIACIGFWNDKIELPGFMHHIEVWMREMEESNKKVLQLLTTHSTFPVLILNIFVMALFPALFEEFFFRGTLQPFFSKWFAKKHIAIIVTAFIFSTIHFQFFGFIPRFLLGIYLGYLFLWGKSLWLPVIAHFLHNALSVIFDYMAQQRGIDVEALEPSQLTGFYPFVFLSTIIVLSGIYLAKNKNII